jgi:hypothetical protein
MMQSALGRMVILISFCNMYKIMHLGFWMIVFFYLIDAIISFENIMKYV